MTRRLTALVALLLPLAACGGGTLDAKSFQKEAESIQSLAAEGALVAKDTASGSTTSPYVTVHAEELAKEADVLAQKLEQAKAEPEVKAKVAKAVELAEQIADDLERLADDPGNRAFARAARSRLADAAKTAEDLAAA